MRLMLFVHWAGICVWLGAQLVFMVFGPASRRMELQPWAATWTTLGRVQRVLVAPAAAAATITGVVLTMAAARSESLDMGLPWLIVMQTAGILAGILALTVVTPLANRMASVASRSLDRGEKDPLAERVRVRLALTGTITGILILVALFSGVLRHH